ncbi:NAD-dependent epimerase/dehydratase family protein [Geochorda subterranea]|uniref:NAD-dependent epimerase/dehydratase family protein n=1 Tax=Geochorda subterranea TaxID=3109564 RepID=A0ABZ1BLB5_9FIRM|nr:NAD-dependent epimerase/dehydratase family protein [Limnochorda sp. LNt]WRP13601.1 NAD-dependent epimerase/dehydratase family protein [Limnochorda sp. LNt]
MRHVAVTGGTGFVGRAVVAALLGRGLQVAVLRRPGRDRRRPREANRTLAEVARSGGRVVEGDLLETGALSELVAGADAVVHLVGIIRERPRQGVTFARVVVEGTRRLVTAARSAGIRRFVLMSALGADPDDPWPYPRTKGLAEAIAREAGFADLVILRPSIIYGPGDGFVGMLARLMRRLPLFPVFGDGAFPLQPVPVWVVAEAVAQAVAEPLPAGGGPGSVRLYEVGGADVLTYRELLAAVAERIGVRPLFVRVPLGWVRAAVRAGQALPGFPVTLQQLELLTRGSTGDARPFYTAFAVPPVPFREGIRAYEI